ncbi:MULTISPECIES: glycosyltransferase family 39 protein [Trichocoleus]|uniref:Glycosyltransferase family 39 protein n=1 Tax=Trichocoleus desertorum GB2-A4 TaxID=2933944 RepID=A0ABV0J6X3_9CYAN|nr:glycosyltransferase family 39 protein [Trichocoleus sp. FACHB-46]MBD1862490.1 glycosyltransferase family 39 protein [Trichocoleus sp. FACHB-46]
MKALSHSRWLHPCLLLGWILLGAALRFNHLANKALWTDEFSTLVFSLGNSFRTVPLDQVITIRRLLEPLQPDPTAGIDGVLQHLMSESTHPPLYFVLAHLWMQLFAPENGLVSIWVGRSLPALLGVVSIPAMFGLGWLTFRSRLAGQLAAMMMAVSPYGLFLAQEARHYTLSILWVIASLSCFVVATQFLRDRRRLPIWIGLAWVVVNSLGIATHYFFGLTLFAEAFVLIGQAITQSRQDPGAWLRPYWRRIYAVVAGTIVGGLIWLPALQSVYGSDLTEWIETSDRWNLMAWIGPIFQALAAWITMLSLLPVEAELLPIVIASGVIMIIYFIWAIPLLHQGFKAQWHSQEVGPGVQVLAGFVLGAIALIFAITYGLGTDLTRGARYNFMYFPGVMALVGASLAAVWNSTSANRTPTEHPSSTSQRTWLPFKKYGKPAILAVLLMGVLSGLTVTNNLGYRKYYRPDLLAPVIQATSQVPTLIATTHNTHVQTGELMGLAWEFWHDSASDSSNKNSPQFLLAHQTCNPKQTPCQQSAQILQRNLTALPRPFDLWLVNFYTNPESALPTSLQDQGCAADPKVNSGVHGYSYQLYHCLKQS